ncbi:hypothetical protein D7X94_04620 [Acutalibacter sp. 1XD8-33]|uniref:hypothetical protein n=1 Tax=Acutalibacter sp. 1XD8-33 TaxID=2320081 RepID=UPI000EA11A5A|nr:hypothetical protein [Acutalibacter sp. 1XD8-33]RKJ41095.1 hypothetical protein D7X94_04620 [Acutalibacter sp. 1XD8-33]
MTNELDKIRKMKKNVLQRHEWNDVEGNKLVNDFLQMSKIAEQLKESDEKAYLAFMSLLKDKIELQEECIDRGKRLGRLSKQEAALRKADKQKAKEEE